MAAAINYLGRLIIKDNQGQIHIFEPETMQQVKTACYRWAQKQTRY